MVKEAKDPLLSDENPKTEGEKSTTPKTEKENVKGSGTPAPAQTPSDKAVAENKDVVAQTKVILEAAPHVSFIIPLADGEREDAAETVQINGYIKIIKKGTLVSIPLPIANLLAEKYRIAMTAGADKRIDRPTPPDHNVQEALG